MATWTIDPVHSEVKFKVKHLVVSTVTGNFQTFSGKLEAEKEDFSDAKISFEADVASINTHNEQRDGHLTSADFFLAGEHPKLTFVSKSIEKKSGSEYVVTGDLNIRGIAKEIKLDVTYNGTILGFGNQPVAGFEITGKVNRKDFGMTFDALTEAGGIIVGEEVKIEIEAEMQKQAAVELAKAA
ncbi:MAG: YceI family protein [Bacteroidota bacterium]|nr:YceI family protein [Bacteroidota bacterium]